MFKRLTALLLVLLLSLSLVGCAAHREALEAANQKAVEFLDQLAAENWEGMYALAYPGTVDHDDFLASAEQYLEYCPVVPGYTLEKETWNVSSKLGSVKEDTVSVSYVLTTGGEVFHLITVYRITPTDRGFIQFRFFNEADYQAAQAQSK